MSTQSDGGPGGSERIRRAQRRAALKLAHPDVGGTTETFLAALAASGGHPGTDPGEIEIRVTLAGRLQGARRKFRRVSRTARDHVPQRFPRDTSTHLL